MKPWEDETLLEMIVFAQQNPECDLGPLRDRIQEKQYQVCDLTYDAGPPEGDLLSNLEKIGYQCNIHPDWHTIRESIGIPQGHAAWGNTKIAIPFPDPQ